MRLETAPTGPGENIELPIYFLKPHLDCDPCRKLTVRATYAR